MTTIRTHAEREQRALALVIALAAAVAAIIAAMMVIGSDDPTAPLPRVDSGTSVNLGAEHAGLVADHASTTAGGAAGSATEF